MYWLNKTVEQVLLLYSWHFSRCHGHMTSNNNNNNNNNNNKFVERHFPMVQWRFTALTKK